MKYKNISGIILAGGKSRRMGFFKPFLIVDGRRMIDVIIDKLRPFFGEIMIVTDRKDNFSEIEGIKVVEDSVKGCGPLGGIYTGLKKMSEKRGFFVACDMPFLHNGLIKRILDAAEGNMQDAVLLIHSQIPSLTNQTAFSRNLESLSLHLIHSQIEPLCAVYSKKILPKIKIALKQKRLSIKDFLKDCHCKYVEGREDERKSFLNINTPEDLKQQQAS